MALQTTGVLGEGCWNVSLKPENELNKDPTLPPPRIPGRAFPILLVVKGFLCSAANWELKSKEVGSS